MVEFIVSITLIAAVVAALYCGICIARVHNLRRELERNVQREVGKLNAMSGRVIAAEGAIDNLALQLRKLRGYVYSPSPSSSSSSSSEPESAIAGCDNWELAKVDGPSSRAAQCDCAYCNYQRANRARARAELLPAARAATLTSVKPR